MKLVWPSRYLVLGIDSLVVIEIRNWWCQRFGLEIGVLEFMNAGNIAQLVRVALNGLKVKYTPRTRIERAGT
jgi:hypothetical protein